MSKKVCSDQKAIIAKSREKKNRYKCRKCGGLVVKEKWACRPEKL